MTAGTDTLITYLDQVAADASVRVFVVADVPLGRSTGDVAGVRLTGTASEATAAGSLGATVTQTAGANTAGVDTVFADTAVGGNTARDGIHFDEDDYTILAANLTATKTSRVISDPLNGTTNPKLIPGAVVEYCISVANAAGSASATNVAISDTLPGTTTYDSSFGIKVNGTVTSGTCNADGAIAGAHASGVVSGTIPTLAAGDTRTCCSASPSTDRGTAKGGPVARRCFGAGMSRAKHLCAYLARLPVGAASCGAGSGGRAHCRAPDDQQHRHDRLGRRAAGTSSCPRTASTSRSQTRRPRSPSIPTSFRTARFRQPCSARPAPRRCSRLPLRPRTPPRRSRFLPTI